MSLKQFKNITVVVKKGKNCVIAQFVVNAVTFLLTGHIYKIFNSRI